jgi:ATP-binding cassette subfamily A (ABC1) protein 3
MGGGKLICCGSSMYLKNKFGVGYNITFVKNSTQIDSAPIINLVTKHIPSAKILSNVSAELAMQLPL